MHIGSLLFALVNF